MCLREWQLPRFVLRGGRVFGLVKPCELSRTYTPISYTRRHGSGWGWDSKGALRVANQGCLLQLRTARRVALPPGTGGSNVRKTARYAEEVSDPLQHSVQ